MVMQKIPIKRFQDEKSTGNVIRPRFLSPLTEKEFGKRRKAKLKTWGERK
jgi:hypothetical protein